MPNETNISIGDSQLVAELRSVLCRLEQALSSISDGLCIVDKNKNIIWCNHSFESLALKPRLSLLGSKIGFIINDLCESDSRLQTKSLVNHLSEPKGSLTLLPSRDPPLFIELEWYPVVDDEKRSTIFCFRDISDRVSKEKLEYKSQQLIADQLRLAAEVTTCPVTGLPNRRGLTLEIEHSLNLNKKNGDIFALLFCDMDRFKEINDTYGHQVGDSMLIELGRRMQEVLRENDIVARLGGDEFVLLCNNLFNQEQAVLIAERLLDVVTKPWKPDGLRGLAIHPSMSVGISVCTDHNKVAEELLKDADIAMYEAKTSLNSRIVMFDKSLYEKAHKQYNLRMAIAESAHLHRFPVVMQPIVDLIHGKTVAYEILLRPLDSESRKAITPDEFISAVESSGQISRIGDLILKSCLSTVASKNLGDEVMYTAVNISGLQITQDTFAKSFIDMVNHFKINPQKICIEITETALISNPEDVAKQLQTLRQNGIKVLLDDFGTGFSSLRWIMDFPIDGLKIDKSFTHSILSDSRSEIVVRQLIGTTNELQLDVVAEGIETKSQSDLLKSMGCGYGQGFLYGRPVAADLI